MATVERFEQLDAWKSARRLNRRVYDITRAGPFARDAGLRDRMRGASLTMMTLIAEGFESQDSTRFVELLRQARGSMTQVRAQLYVALDVGHLRAEQFDELYRLATDAGRHLHRLTRHLIARPASYRLMGRADSGRHAPDSGP